MNLTQRPTVTADAAPRMQPDPHRAWKRLAWVTAGLVLGFGWPLYELVRFSLPNDLYSHIPLIPFISAYLVWQQRRTLPMPGPGNRRLTLLLLAGGIFVLSLYAMIKLGGPAIAHQDELALTTSSLLLLFVGGYSAVLGRQIVRATMLPLGFLVFMIPLPTAAMPLIEVFLQHGSAEFAHAFYVVAGTPVLRDDLVFQLPGFSLQIAPECSGIHSTLALLITSIIAGYYFLRSRINRTILALAVIPLALVRNGFRVFVIGELCVHIDPSMINSPIHHHGGPIFFALSLIPFGLLLWVLIRIERRSQARV